MEEVAKWRATLSPEEEAKMKELDAFYDKVIEEDNKKMAIKDKEWKEYVENRRKKEPDYKPPFS